MRVEFCESCGAPLEAAWTEIVVVCRYCGAHVLPGGAGAPVPPSLPDDGRPRLHVGGRTYLLEGLLGQGEACDVYRGRWVIRLGELVVLKVLRSLADADLLRREWAVVQRLEESSAQGADRFVRRLPQTIAMGPVRSGAVERLVAVFGWQSGFFHTLADVTRAFPDGVDGRVAVWVWKRLLELLGFVHRSGLLHGAVLPPHVLVHPRDHGAMLVGWSAAVAGGGTEPLPALSRDWLPFYPAPTAETRRATPATDVAMAARCVQRAAGAKTFDQPGSLPGALGRLLIEAASGRRDDAWSLLSDVDRAAQQEYGPPAYSPLPMPGWIPVRS